MEVRILMLANVPKFPTLVWQVAQCNSNKVTKFAKLDTHNGLYSLKHTLLKKCKQALRYVF